MNQILLFDTVIVIESLKEDYKTGTWLTETVLRPLAKNDHNLDVRLVSVFSAADLFDTLAIVSSQVAAKGHAPIIHLEAHGDADGIETASGERVSWRELKPVLAEINQHTRLNLLVVMALCSGAHLIKIVSAIERAPVWAIVGPLGDVAASEMREAMRNFYSTLLVSLDGRAAIRAMNQSELISEGHFKLFTAEMIFCWAFEHYVRDVSTETTQERENRLVAFAVREQQLDIVQASRARVDIRAMVLDHRTWYTRLRGKFLMFDMFPEIPPRFPLSYDDCIAARSST